MLIMDNYNAVVKKGFICYVKNGNRLKEVIYEEKDFLDAQKIIDAIFRIIDKGFFPKKTSFEIRCIDCCYKNICPK